MTAAHIHLPVFALLVIAGCTPSAHYDTGQVLPDFALEDVNPSSSSYGQAVAPSDFRAQVSAWYFGHAN